MGRSKKLRKQIDGMKRQIERHYEKIVTEKDKTLPDLRRIGKWEKDIETFKKEIEKLHTQLARKRKKGA